MADSKNESNRCRATAVKIRTLGEHRASVASAREGMPRIGVLLTAQYAAIMVARALQQPFIGSEYV
jgi:hypothetical protein